MFQVGDKIAHPLHGAGTICEIEEKRIDGKMKCYYVMHAPKGDLRIMIPTDTCDKIGIRSVLTRSEAENILHEIPSITFVDDSNWNRRYRENMQRIKSGDLLQVAGVIRARII